LTQTLDKVNYLSIFLY